MQKTPLVITACIIVAAIAGLVILRWAGKGQEPEPEAAPPEIRQVIEHTRELLRLVANKDGAEIVRRFYKPDTERYGKRSSASTAPGTRTTWPQCLRPSASRTGL